MGDGIESAVFPIAEALRMAEERGVDLVEIAPTATPPVCKVINYKKFLYEQKRKQKELKAKTQRVVVKEIRFGPHTDEHDLKFKIKHAEKFLSDGAKVRAFIFFKGRTIMYKEQGEYILNRMAKELENFGTIESAPKLDGKKMFMTMIPKRRK